MKIVMSSGHGKYIRGASGILDEVDEARRVVESVAAMMRAAGSEVTTFHDDTSHDQSTNLETIVDFHNARTRDLDISVHFNAYQSTASPMGTEVLYVTQSSLAAKVSGAIASAAQLPNRGGKKRTDLYFLNNTEMPAILIETCFVDSSTDADHYHARYDDICQAISDSIVGASEQPPVETQPPPVDVEEVVDVVITAPAGVRVEVRVVDGGERRSR